MNNYKHFGFKREGTKVYNLFSLIPIFPEVITFKTLSEKLKVSTTQVKDIVNKFPTLAPVFEDEKGKYISRIK